MSSLATILIVDDDAMNREVMEAFLSLENYAVQLARNGAEGLASAHTHLPDLIILDVKMPDMDGYSVCIQLKADARTQHIPVIIATGYDGAEDRARGEAAGADFFLPRPFRGTELLEAVREVLSAAANG